jgi:hypothetical protein
MLSPNWKATRLGELSNKKACNRCNPRLLLEVRWIGAKVMAELSGRKAALGVLTNQKGEGEFYVKKDCDRFRGVEGEGDN